MTVGASVATGDPGGPTTNGVVADVAVAVPSPFFPETTIRIVDARSPSTMVYVDAVAPGIGAQPRSGSMQRSHW